MNRTPPESAPAKRRAAWRTPRGAALVFGALALVQAGIGYSLTAPSSSPAPDLTLTSDADGTSLFAASGLAPGHPVTRCLRLTYGNAVSGDQLKLVASSSGTLASHLHVRVDAGTRGDAAGCTGVTASPLYP